MRYFLVVSFAAILLFYDQPAFAQSDYFLPYPSSMPGSTLYKVRLILEQLSKYWYFGDFGQFLYNLKESDKYLVEAKTLFEYEQYLLGQKALKKSDVYFKQIKGYLIKARKNGKDVVKNTSLLQSASLKHIEILTKLKKETPQDVNWKPEKKSSENLHLWNDIDQSIKIRGEFR